MVECKMRISEEKTQELMATFIEIKLHAGIHLKDVANELRFIGIMNTQRTKLCQTAYILSKRGKYFLVHFKQLLQLDGREVHDFSNEDKLRLQWIAKSLASDGNLFDIVNPEQIYSDFKDAQLNLTRIVARDVQTFEEYSWVKSDGLVLHPMYNFD